MHHSQNVSVKIYKYKIKDNFNSPISCIYLVIRYTVSDVNLIAFFGTYTGHIYSSINIFVDAIF